MTPRFVTTGPSETERAGEVLAPLLRAGDVVALSGDLGAGKTHLVQGVAVGLGISEAVTSPTFNIMLVHHGRLPLYHLDLYRLEREEELVDIDFFETLEGDGVSMVEWGDRFPHALPPDHLRVDIHRLDGDGRRFDLCPAGARGAALADAWLEALKDVTAG